MTSLELSRLVALLERPCPTEVDPMLWRRCQEAVRAATAPKPFHTPDGKPWPHEGGQPAYPPSDPREFY